jgi:hypothetical protein
VETSILRNTKARGKFCFDLKGAEQFGYAVQSPAIHITEKRKSVF